MTKTMLILAGAAIGSGSVASAANPSLDIDRALASELSADAAGRTSLLQGSGSAGYDDTTDGSTGGGFFIRSADGNYEINFGALLQFRYVAGFRDDDGVDEEFTHGFERPRTGIWLQGHVVNPQVTYRVSFDAGVNNDISAEGALRDAWAQYNFEGEGEGFWVRWGQFKAPVLFEENVEAQYQLGLERGPVNEFFSPGYSEGILVGYDADQFSITGIFTDGIRAPAAFGATAGTIYGGADTDYGFGVRADVYFGGDKAQFGDFTGVRGQDTAARVGGAFYYQSGGDTGTSTGGTTVDAEYYLWTIDASIEGDGWSVYGAYIGHTLDIEGGVDVTNHGVVLQGGFYLADQFEIFGGWNFLSLDEEFVDALGTGLDEEDFHFLNVGGNYYFVPNSHALKFTVDVLWALDDNLPTTVNTNLGDTGLLGGTEDEFLIRAQVQVLF